MTHATRRFLTVARAVPVLVLTAFAVAGAFVGAVMLGLAGSFLGDPGGWRGLALAAGVVALVLGLAVLALLDPDSGSALVGLLALGPIALGVWSFLDRTGLRAWEDRTGPVTLVLVVVAASGAAVLGLQRPSVGGGFLLLVTVVPAGLAVAGAGAGWAAAVILALIPAPLVVAGGLFLLAAYGAWHEEGTARRRRTRHAPRTPRVPPLAGPRPA